MTTIASYEPTGTDDDLAQPQPGPALPVLSAPIIGSAPHKSLNSLLGPVEDFPEDLTGLGMADLQVLRSKDHPSARS